MSLPGLGLDESDEEVPTGSVGTIRTDSHVIPKENEWRFEVALNKTVKLKVRRRISTPDTTTDKRCTAHSRQRRDFRSRTRGQQDIYVRLDESSSLHVDGMFNRSHSRDRRPCERIRGRRDDNE